MSFLSIDCSMHMGIFFLKIKNKSFNKILQRDKYDNDLLMKKILDFLQENNVKLDDLSEIFVNRGPGNFSSLRSSISVAKGISLAKNLQLFGYDTFLLSCAKFFSNHQLILNIFKYKEKYFLKSFKNNLTSNEKIKQVTKEEILNKYKKNFKVITKNNAKYFDDEILKLNNLNIVSLDYTDLEMLRLKGLLEKDLLKPIYLT